MRKEIMKKQTIVILVLAMVLSLVGCASKKSSDEIDPKKMQENITQIRDAVASSYEYYIPSMQYEAEQVKELFGVDSIWYDASIAEGPMMSTHVDTFIAIHPTKGNLQNVEKALNDYRDYLINDSLQYPMNQPKVEASLVEVIDDVVYFIMLGAIDEEIMDEGLMLEAYKAQNEIAVDVIKDAKSL